jgi:hypothetical protein
VALLVTLVLSISFRSHLRPIILPAFLITLPYIVMDASISRYGVLIVPLGAILLVELLAPKDLLGEISVNKNSTVDANLDKPQDEES